MAITAAVKESDPQCEPFVGVLIEHHAPRSREDTNWAVKGIRFGRADHDKCSATLVAVIDEMQGAFELRQDAAPARPPAQTIKLTETREITPYVWVHPDEDR